MILERPDGPIAGASEFGAGLDRHNFANSLTAFLFAVTGPLAILIGVAVEGGMDQRDIASWIFGAYGVGGVLTILFCVTYRQPLALAWTIPGVVLLAGSLDHLPFDQVVGAFFVTAGLLVVLGATGWVRRIMGAIPLPIVMGMVAGVFLPLGLNIVTAFDGAIIVAAATLGAFLLISVWPALARLLPPVLGALLAGAAAAWATGGVTMQVPLTWQLVDPVFYAPSFTYQACFELVIPLAVTVVAIQNGQGFVILRAAGFEPPRNLLTLACGIGSVFAGAVGSVPTCVTGPVNGILNTSGVKERRWVGGVLFGVMMVAFALFSPVATSLALALPTAFIGMLGGLALLPVLRGAFVAAFESRFQLGALISFMVTMSNVTILNIGAAFWGLVFGFAASILLERGDFAAARQD